MKYGYPRCISQLPLFKGLLHPSPQIYQGHERTKSKRQGREVEEANILLHGWYLSMK